MAVAVAPRVSNRSQSQVRAASWASLGAGIALIATIPLVLMLAGPVADVLFVRGSALDGNWGAVMSLVFVYLAPATYALFFGTAGELLKTRVSAHVHRTTMRVAAAGMVPYVALVVLAVFWEGGPQNSLLQCAAISIPIAMVTTIWASTQNH